MSNTYTWVISQLDAYPQHEEHTDVVFTIHWRRQATDGNGHNADIYGSQSVTLAPDAPFTPYADLTEAQVIGWLEDAMGAETLAAVLPRWISRSKIRSTRRLCVRLYLG